MHCKIVNSSQRDFFKHLRWLLFLFFGACTICLVYSQLTSIWYLITLVSVTSTFIDRCVRDLSRPEIEVISIEVKSLLLLTETPA